MHVFGAGLDRIPHELLIALIEDIGGMVSITAVGPSLHPTEPGVGLVVPNGIDEHGEPRFIRGLDTAVMACLLQRDKIIFAITKGLAQCYRILNNPRTRVRTHAMTVRSGVFEQKLGMLLKRTTAVIEVVNLDVNMPRIAKRHEFLFYRVPGKAISDTQNTDQ